MGSELEPELAEAIELLKQDGRFDIRRLGGRRIAVNGIVVDLNFRCRDVTKCMEMVLTKFKYAAEMPLEVLPVEDGYAAELLKEHPELEAFGREWVKKWGRLRDRLVEIAEALRRYPWMADVVGQEDPHPYLVEVYVALDGSEVCLQLNHSRTFCNGKRAEFAPKFIEHNIFEERIHEIYRSCKKYAKIL
jgi:hypothetical protein